MLETGLWLALALSTSHSLFSSTIGALFSTYVYMSMFKFVRLIASFTRSDPSTPNPTDGPSHRVAYDNLCFAF